MASQRRKLFSVIAVAIALASSCTGCSVECAGAYIPVPAVWLDGSPWLAAHPGQSLRACFAEHCQIANREQVLVQLMQGNTQLGQLEPLTVTTAPADAEQLISRRVALKEFTEPGAPCGDIDTWV